MKGDVNSGEASSEDCCLLEFAANNDLTGFKQLVEDGAKVDEVGTWYCRKNGSTEMVLEQRTPAMIASLYGSLDVLNYILRCYTESAGDINRRSGSDGSTALHCAAGGGSPCAIETVSLLIDFGADLNVCDAQGRSPADVIMVSPKLGPMKMALARLLKGTESAPVTSSAKLSSRGLSIDVTDLTGDACLPDEESVFESAAQFNITGQPFSGDSEHIFIPSPYLFHEMASSSMLSSSPSSPKFLNKDSKVYEEGEEKIRDFMVDPSLPDIKNSIYATDEFRMFSFKIRPCSRAYSHDWTECPFVHPSENARRRDPRKYHYSCVPCPDFRKGACRRGDACEYAHGVFECWLHPAQYRTRLCKDGINCTRRVCFFAHTTEELRPLYVSTGSSLPSPRTLSSVDLSPSSQFRSTSPSVLTISPFSPSRPSLNTLSTPPQSPLSSSNQFGAAWAQSNNVSALLPGVGYHTSRLRAALNAKDITVEDLNEFSDFDTQPLNDLTQPSSQSLSTQIRLNAAIAAASGCGNSSRVGKYRNLGLAVSQSNLEDLFASETIPSPGSGVQEVDFLSQLTAQLHAHKSSQLHSQCQNLGQSQLAYAATQMQLQQSIVDCHLQDRIQLQSSPQTSSFSMALPSTISFGLDSEQQRCASVPFTPSVAAVCSPLPKSDMRSQSSRDLGAGLVWSDWGSPTGKPEWGVHRDDLWKLRKSASFGCKRSEESDVPGVQKPIKEGPLDTNVAESPSEGTSNEHKEISDNALLNAWIEQLHLDQIAA